MPFKAWIKSLSKRNLVEIFILIPPLKVEAIDALHALLLIASCFSWRFIIKGFGIK